MSQTPVLRNRNNFRQDLLPYLLFYYRRHSWRNGYHRRKWNRLPEFKSWTRLFAFHIALIPWERYESNYSPSICGLFNLRMATCLKNEKLWIQVIVMKRGGSHQAFRAQDTLHEFCPLHQTSDILFMTLHCLKKELNLVSTCMCVCVCLCKSSILTEFHIGHSWNWLLNIKFLL